MQDALPLFATLDVRAIDAAAIAGGIGGYALMTRAAAAALETLRARWPDARKLLVLCGPGNNGGDGYVLARLARAAGLLPRVVTLPTPPRTEDARRARAEWEAAGGGVESFAGGTLPDADLLVDALFGIGLDRAPEGLAAALIAAADALRVPRLALDVPSGVDAERGCVHGAAIRADLTLSFIARKRGLATGPALDKVGRIELASLEVPGSAFSGCEPAAWRVDAAALSGLPRRRPDAHKGDHGHVLAVGGDLGAGGALLLCVAAALRGGAGLVSALTRAEHVAAFLSSWPECMVHASAAGELPAPLSRRATVIALGPGLGQGDWGRALFAALVDDPRPRVLDADALNLLAQAPRRLANAVLTPHPGEAARLLGASAGEVQSDRFGALDALVARFGCAVVLKGAGTLVGAPGERPVVIGAGNPGMAVGGMGDVLTGVVAALLAQGLAPFEAAWRGALLHAVAGDLAALGGRRGLLPSDLLPLLRGDPDASR